MAKRDYKPVEPKPKLSPEKLYFGDNGAVFCGALDCAGMTAHFTGRTIAGQKVRAAKTADANEFDLHGLTLACEGCRKPFSPPGAQP